MLQSLSKVMSTRPMPFRLLVLLVSTHRENCRTFDSHDGIVENSQHYYVPCEEARTFTYQRSGCLASERSGRRRISHECRKVSAHIRDVPAENPECVELSSSRLRAWLEGGLSPSHVSDPGCVIFRDCGLPFVDCGDLCLEGHYLCPAYLP